MKTNSVFNYERFMDSSFVKYLKNNNISTFELCSFVNSLIGAENFLKNHPKPVKEYYKDNPSYITFSPHYKSIDYDNTTSHTFTIKELEEDIKKVKIMDNISTQFIIQNEHLWNMHIFDERWHHKFSSDDWEYYESYKTGWTYLAQNKNIMLDMQLIYFLKDKIVPIRYERMGVLAGRYGDLELKEEQNCLNLFNTHKIHNSCIPNIMNDPINWENIFYNQEFCNQSILEYIRYFIPIIDFNINAFDTSF